MSVHLGMSDDDFLNAPPPAVEAPVSGPTAEELAALEAERDKGLELEDPVLEEIVEPELTAEELAAKALEDEANAAASEGKGEVVLTDEEQLAAKPPAKAPELKDPKLDENGKPVVEVPPKVDTPPASAEPKDIDYKAEYEKLMQPLTANGKKIDLRDPSELVKLAQQGANYTQKMQQLAPHRKALLMLQNNGIDESQLDYLISLSKKDPVAIQKLVKESGLNPLDIDVEVEPAFKGGSHVVTDEAAHFQEMLDNMVSTPEGVATLQVINTTWDQASKDALYTDPGIASTILEQKSNGVYDVITAEVERYRMLGEIPAGTSFLQAYKQVGDHLVKTGGFASLVEKNEPVKQTPAAPVATRVVAPKPVVSNDEKAKAATASRAAPRQAKVIQNPLEMSDEDFLKQFNGRL